MKGINTWGRDVYSKLLKQQLADDSLKKESESETKTAKIHPKSFCFSCCFTVLVGDFGHSFHGNFLQKATSKLGTNCCFDPRQGHDGREFVAPETRV